MKVHGIARLLGLAVGAGLLVATGGCGDDTTAPQIEETALLSVIPQGGATGVDPNGPLVIEFSHPMHQGMEEYADVHEGDVEGPLVEGSWSWNEPGIQGWMKSQVSVSLLVTRVICILVVG